MKIDNKVYVEQLLRALKIAQQEEVDTHRLLTEQVAYKERIKAGITLYPVEFREISYNDFGDQLLSFKLNPNQEGTAFSSGKSVEIFNAEGDKTEGILIRLKLDEAVVKIGEEDVQDWIKKGKIGINSLVDTKTYQLYEKTLREILKEAPYPIFENFYSLNQKADNTVEFSSNRLNENQNKAVKEMLSDNMVSLIHGPPGTGKTTTLVEGIREMISREMKVLLCAPSNAAVDNCCLQLMKKGVKVVRIGNESKVDDQVSAVYLETLIRSDRSYNLLLDLKNRSKNVRENAFKFRRNFGKDEHEERKQLKAELRSLKSDIRKVQADLIQNVLEKAEVIAGTFYGVQAVAEKLQPFDAVVVDEGGQAIEPAIWSVAHFGKKLVVAGDELQLPATVISHEAEKLGLAVSLLEQAEKIGYPKQLLNVQYRMNSLIMEFSNQQFYGGKLTADQSVANRTLPKNEHTPVEFIDTAGCGFEEEKDAEGGGIRNPGEVKVLQNILKEYPTTPFSIGVITPYRAQLNFIEDALRGFEGYANTVDSFQGQERDIIIISLVRSNESGDIGFLKDYRRMNVAMTRAKMKLVIIGDSATIGIGQDSFYNDFLKYVEENATYRTAWEFMS
ncbi:MAG: IGHMBP2 family helicase [Crocinitomicaceae bacterium]